MFRFIDVSSLGSSANAVGVATGPSVAGEYEVFLERHHSSIFGNLGRHPKKLCLPQDKIVRYVETSASTKKYQKPFHAGRGFLSVYIQGCISSEKQSNEKHN